MAKRTYFTPNVRITNGYVGKSLPKPVVSKSVQKSLFGNGQGSHSGIIDSGAPTNNVWGNSPTEVWGESPTVLWGM